MQTKLTSIFFLFFIVFGFAIKTKGQVKAPFVTKVKSASLDTLPYIKINKLTYYQHPLCLEYYALTDTTYIPTWYGAYCSLFNPDYFKNYPEDAVGLVQKRLGITKEKMEERKKKLESEDGSKEKSMSHFTYIYGEVWLTYLPTGEKMIINMGFHSKEEIPNLTFKHPKGAKNPDKEITDSIFWSFNTAFIYEDGIYKYADQMAVFKDILSKHYEYQIISLYLPYFKDLLYRAPTYINSTIKDGKRMFETIERKEDTGLVSKPFVGGVGSKTAGTPGTGVSYALAGSKCQSLPSPVVNQNIEGNVVVEITVDRQGKVITAKPGVKGTTTMDETLWEAAKSAALQATFEPKVNGPEIQKGYITYRFRVQ